MVELRSGKRASSDNVAPGKSRSRKNRSKPDSKTDNSKAPVTQAKAVRGKKNSPRVKKESTSIVPKKRSNNDESKENTEGVMTNHDNDVKDDEAPVTQAETIRDKEGLLRVKKPTTSTTPKKRSNNDEFEDDAEAETVSRGNDVKSDRDPDVESEPDTARGERQPTPGRIINPREVNENGAKPIPSTGDPKD